MQVPTEWRYFSRPAKALIALYVLAYLVATSTHSLDLITRGMYRVASVPNWINWFWFCLTFLDPLAVLVLLARVPAGIVLMLGIIYADVAINAFVTLRLAGPEHLLDFFFLCQSGFLLFISATCAVALKASLRPWVAKTERLCLRPLRPGDLRPLARVLTDPESMAWYPSPLTLAQTRNWIRRNRARYRKYGFGLWAVIHRETGMFVGDCGVTLQTIDGEVLPEVGWHTLPEWRGRGFAPEAGAAAIGYCAARFGIRTVYSYCEEGNLPSRRVMEKLGMEIVKTYEEKGKTKVVYRRQGTPTAAPEGEAEARKGER